MTTLGFPVVMLYIFVIPGFIAFTLIRQRKAHTLFVHQPNYNQRLTIRFGFMFAGELFSSKYSSVPNIILSLIPFSCSILHSMTPIFLRIS